MKRSRFSEEQIIGILKEREAGLSVADLCRKHGVSDASIYKWKAKFGRDRGVGGQAARRCDLSPAISTKTLCEIVAGDSLRLTELVYPFAAALVPVRSASLPQ
jgi:transposase-like protein